MSERDLKRLLALWEKALGKEWIDAAEWLRSLDANSAAEIERRIIAGDISGLIADAEQAALRFAAEAQAAHDAAGRAGAKWLDGQPALSERLIRYDADDPRVIDAARRNRIELVRGEQQETRAKIRNILTDGARTGENPRVLARQVRDSIGLTEYQEQIVRNYRRALETGDFDNAMGRELHDARFDPRLRRIAGTNGGLTPKQIDDMTDRYRQNWIDYRAETIARTESSRNVHAGLDESFRQAVTRGDLEADQLVREWIHAGRGRSRPDHLAMDGQRVKFGEKFRLPDGVQMAYPGDPDGGAKHTANCRCTIATVFDDKPPPDTPSAPSAPDPIDAPRKNPRRQEAARTAAAASVERRREIHSAARANLPSELHAAWDREGHKFMRQEVERIRGIKDRINASSKLSQAFAEKYGSGAETMFGNEGDRYYRRAEIDAQNAIDWADEQQRKYYAQMEREYRERLAGQNSDNDDPPF